LTHEDWRIKLDKTSELKTQEAEKYLFHPFPSFSANIVFFAGWYYGCLQSVSMLVTEITLCWRAMHIH
jgi:hypothetical protein